MCLRRTILLLLISFVSIAAFAASMICGTLPWQGL
jgi:hypothetical protein